MIRHPSDARSNDRCMSPSGVGMLYMFCSDVWGEGTIHRANKTNLLSTSSGKRCQLSHTLNYDFRGDGNRLATWQWQASNRHSACRYFKERCLPRRGQRTPSVIILLAMVDERELQLIISAEWQFRQIYTEKKITLLRSVTSVQTRNTREA